MQSFQITVSNYDTAPVITSTAPSPAVVGVAYRYAVKAQDSRECSQERKRAISLGKSPTTKMNSRFLPVNSCFGHLATNPKLPE